MLRGDNPWSKAWWLVLACGLGFLWWNEHARIRRVDHLTNSAIWSVDTPVNDGKSVTGYADEQRRLLVPGNHHASYPWIVQTQQMLAHGEWRIRRVDYENFPAGRATSATSPYRWWLGGVAWLDHRVTGSSLGIAVEHAARYADPILFALLIFGVTWFAARNFGGLAAALAGWFASTVFPLVASFHPGAPDEHSLAWLCGTASVLLLLAGVRAVATDSSVSSHPGANQAEATRTARRWFAGAGVFGGLGLWNDAASEWPILAGIAAGAIVFTVSERIRSSPIPTPRLPWRAWAVGGAVICVLGYLIEYFPGLTAAPTYAVHPLQAVAWLGVGGVLTLSATLGDPRGDSRRARGIVVGIISVLAIAALPVASAVMANGRWIADDSSATELSILTETAAPNLLAWLERDGFTLIFWASCLPAIVLIVASAIFFIRTKSSAVRLMLGLCLGPALVALAMASAQLRWWNMVDATLLALLIPATWAATEGVSRTAIRRFAWSSLIVAALLPGAFVLVERSHRPSDGPLSERDALVVLQRDLAYWLVKHTGSRPTAVLSTPDLTETLAFYGSIKGLCTFSAENPAGLSAAVRIVSATTRTEAAALLASREITHLIVPSWDSTLDGFVRLGRGVDEGAALPPNALMSAVNQWILPPWIRPLPYHLPSNPGFEDLSVTVLEITREDDEVLALCRLTDYFIEMGLLDRLADVRDRLKLFPRDLNALVALAETQLVTGDQAGFGASVDSLLPRLSGRGARALPFDRRLSLAIVLGQAKHLEQAREQLRLCLAEIDEARVRQLNTGAIVRLFTLCRLTGQEIADSRMRNLALDLLPPGTRRLLLPAASR